MHYLGAADRTADPMSRYFERFQQVAADVTVRTGQKNKLFGANWNRTFHLGFDFFIGLRATGSQSRRKVGRSTVSAEHCPA